MLLYKDRPIHSFIHRKTIINLSWRIKRIAREDRLDDGRNSGTMKMVDSDGYEKSTVFDKMDSDVHIHHSHSVFAKFVCVVVCSVMDIGKITAMIPQLSTEMNECYFK